MLLFLTIDLCLCLPAKHLCCPVLELGGSVGFRCPRHRAHGLCLRSPHRFLGSASLGDETGKTCTVTGSQADQTLFRSLRYNHAHANGVHEPCVSEIGPRFI